MIKYYLDSVIDSISDLLYYIDGVTEFEDLLGSVTIANLRNLSDDCRIIKNSLDL